MSKPNEYELGQAKIGRGPGRGPGGRPPGPPGPPMGFMEKPKDFKGGWLKIFQFARRYVPIMILAAVCAIAGCVITLIGPQYIKEITNVISAGLMGTMDIDRIVRIAVTLGILYGAGALLNYTQGYSMVTITQKLQKQLRTALAEKINRLPLRYFDSNQIGDILSRITNDVDMLGMSLNQSLTQFVTSVVMLFGSLIMMIITNGILALTAVVSTLIGFVFVRMIISRSRKYFKLNQDLLGEINGHIEEIYAGHTIVKAFNGEKEARRKFEEINDQLYNAGWRSQFLSGLMMPLMATIGNIGYVAVCIVGAALAKNGVIDFGVIVAFIIYVRMFMQPLNQLAQAATSLQSTAAASERVFEFLDEEELDDESHKTARLTDVKGDVKFDNVVFGYTPDKTVIKGFSADIKAGQKVAIVGPTGAGKTTLVNLLMRFYEVGSGAIYIDGVDIRDLTRENVHDLFCMVLQDTWLFEGTIKENIIYSKKGVTDEDVVRACKAVGLHHFIKTLPQGYDTVLGDNAALSAGQRQLLTIARAMVENAPLLILDEATSSVDTRTELLVQQAMDTLMKGRTSFVIAHRLSTIRNADIILVMKDGDIIESGRHEELLRKGGFYAELYNSQFEQVS
ncbi:MAG: ABC transporter ATP-binding protein [Clostridiales bacterium]|nr:ABC transporter ATP-binding protein [Clostridiales bacterium]